MDDAHVDMVVFCFVEILQILFFATVTLVK